MTATGLEPTTTSFINEHSTIQSNWQVWLNGWVFVYELSGCEFESSCSHLNFRFRACFEQGVPWDSGNYRVWIHSETRTWHDKNIQSCVIMFSHMWSSSFKLSLIHETVYSTNPMFGNFLFLRCNQKSQTTKSLNSLKGNILSKFISIWDHTFMTPTKNNQICDPSPLNNKSIV